MAPDPTMSSSSDDLVRASSASAEFEALLPNAAPGWNGANNLPQVVSYSFSEVKPARESFLDEGWQPFSNVQRASTREALSRWDNASGIVFVEIPDPGDDARVDLRFHLADFSYSYAGMGAYPADGSIWMNRTYYRDDSMASGSFGFLVLMHEIGHAIGFKHPFDGANVLPEESDNTTRTVMSYTRTSSSSNTDIGDIDRAAAIHVYGEQSAQPTWVSNAIWSNAHQAVLQQGAAGADAIRGTTGRDVLLGEAGGDSLTGLGGDDQLWGGTGNDVLTGGAGDDLLVGGDGVDTAIFTGLTFNHRFFEADGRLLVDGWDGADVLSGVETLMFGGVSYTMTSLGAFAGGIVKLTYAQTGPGLAASKPATAYSGPVETVRFQYLGSSIGEAVAGTVSNDFINALGCVDFRDSAIF
jgi:serralysin